VRAEASYWLTVKAGKQAAVAASLQIGAAEGAWRMAAQLAVRGQLLGNALSRPGGRASRSRICFAWMIVVGT